MIENIVRTISGEDKPKITQPLHRSIRNCISTYITNASLLLYSKLDSANTGTDPQQEDDDMIVDMINNADTPPQPGSAVANCNIQQEDTLKNLLSKHFTRRNRAFTIERHNGKDTVVVARPSSKDPNSFVREADCSKWIDKLLPDATYVNGMCMYLARKHTDNYEKVAQLYSLKVQKRVPTIKTLAIASKVGLGDR